MGSEVTRGCAVGIDPGERWIGVGRAAHGSSLALPVGTLDRRAVENDITGALRSLLGNEPVTELVIGVPVRPDGREDDQATAFREFGEALARTLGATCIPQNERFSSEPRSLESLEPISNSRGQGRKARAQGRKSAQRQRRDRERSHAAAAARILQRWLDTREHRQAREARDAAERAT